MQSVQWERNEMGSWIRLIEKPTEAHTHSFYAQKRNVKGKELFDGVQEMKGQIINISTKPKCFNS